MLQLERCSIELWPQPARVGWPMSAGPPLPKGGTRDGRVSVLCTDRSHITTLQGLYTEEPARYSTARHTYINHHELPHTLVYLSSPPPPSTMAEALANPLVSGVAQATGAGSKGLRVRWATNGWRDRSTTDRLLESALEEGCIARMHLASTLETGCTSSYGADVPRLRVSSFIGHLLGAPAQTCPSLTRPGRCYSSGQADSSACSDHQQGEERLR